MAVNKSFSQFKDPKNIKVSPRRKIAHSLRDKLKSMTVKDHIGQVVPNALDATGHASTGAAIVAVAGVSGAAVTALTGPAVGITLGIAAILQTAKSTYSNREKAHAKLTDYVWSYIDDEPPRQPLDDDAKSAALGLLLDGQAQTNRLPSKLADAERKFNQFNVEYNKLVKYHTLFDVSKNDQKTLPSILPKLFEAEEKRQDLLDAAFASNGAIFEYMRRLVHAGNYIQATKIFAKVMEEDDRPLEDFTISDKANDVRNMLKHLSDRFERHERITAEAAQKAMVIRLV
jgi:hypothetical protein